MKRVFSALVLAALVAAMLTGCGLTVPRPEIKEGKFDFSVTYELNGETKTISGVYVCEYNGTDWALDGGSHRDWKGCIEGGSEDDCFEIGTTEDGGVIIISMHLSADYFMGENVTGGLDLPEPELMIQYPYDELGGMQMIREAEIIEQNYGAKIISYEYDAPIENSFGLFK